MPSSASTQLNSTTISIEAEIALFPVSDKPPTQPPVKVVGRCNPNPVNTSKSLKKRGRFVVKIKLTNVRICSLNSTQLNSISTQTTELGTT